MMKLLVTGGHGFLGGHLLAQLGRMDDVEAGVFSSVELDLRDPSATQDYFFDYKPDAVIHLAARVGGIEFNKTRHAEQLRDNTLMLFNVLEACRSSGCGKLVLCGSVCAYASNAPVPFSEDTGLFCGPPEETVLGYGSAKRMFITAAQAYRKQYGLKSCVPVLANLYGPGDSFDPSSCHVIPAMIRRFSEALAEGRDELVFWGTGRASREFLYSGDAARVIAECLARDIELPFNVGSGEEVTMSELAGAVAREAGYSGRIRWDVSKPDGHPRRKLDLTRFSTIFPEFTPTPLQIGLKLTVEFFIKHFHKKGLKELRLPANNANLR
ncbi:MAG: NAD-dependent epimerase/dehydratase family protein [Victivallales bacterium]|nr:NAD-dependent epimerase/dehydratase family protein [Victivallales bacterium]